MKNKFIIVYTTFASLVFVFAVSFFAANLYKEYSYGPARTSATFNSIISDIRTKSKTSDPQTIISNLNKHFGKYTDFASIKISYNDKDLLKYPSNYSESQQGSKLTKKYKSSITTDDGSFYIDCDLYLLRPYSIFYFAKISFLIILIITIVTVILIVYLNMSTEPSSVALNTEENTTTIELETTDNTSNTTEVTEEEPVSATSSQNIDIASETTSEPNVIENETITEEQKIEASSESVEEIEHPKAVLPSEEIKPANISFNDSENKDQTPEGLFNPETGFGWEQYLLTRLDSEINRSIASEIDMSLFVIQLPELERNSEMLKNVCNYLAIQFQFKDLLFEYKNDCLVAMKISMDIDEALIFADKIYADIRNIIQDKNCFIGISTRSIRMVSGERLLHEADEALVHAKDDEDSPIIAFRVDAEKYRQFLERKD